MLEQTETIINPLGLHARAAAQLIRTATPFKAAITLERCDNGASANARSILSVLHIAACYGVEVRILANGDDELEAMAAVSALFRRGFGEI